MGTAETVCHEIGSYSSDVGATSGHDVIAESASIKSTPSSGYGSIFKETCRETNCLTVGEPIKFAPQFKRNTHPTRMK